MSNARSQPTGWRIVVWGLIAIFAAIVLPFLLFLVARIFYTFPMNYNEGWNVMYTARLLAGGPLYGRLDDFPLTPMNYPPLSFAIIGGLSYLTGDILLTGRIVSLGSSLIVSLLIFRIVDNVTGQKSAAAFGALFWFGLMTRLGGYRLVMHDPQLLAHAVSFAAFGLFSEWRDALTPRRVCLLSLLCCLALFVKHLVATVPVVLAAALLFENRRAFWIFALSGAAFATAMAYASWYYGGSYLLSNFIDAGRAVENGRLIRRIRQIFIVHFGWLIFLPFILLAAGKQKTWMPYLLYFCLSFALGAYASRGVGVDINAWFEFFIAAAIVVGIFTGSLACLADTAGWRSVLACGALSLALVPLSSIRRGDLRKALDYGALRHSDEAYRRQVRLLQAIPGPALFESLLLGFDAGKEFLLEPFNAAQMMASGRIRESILTDAIRLKKFTAVVFEFDLRDAVCSLNGTEAERRNMRVTTRDRWTANTLKTVDRYYEPLDKERFPYYFYVPRKNGTEAGAPCPEQRKLS
jgi:hypothetical protein